MDHFEFELRYKAYQGLANLCKLSRSQEKLIDMVAITDRGIPDKKIQDISPEGLKELTKATYTQKKLHVLQDTKEFSENFTKEEFYQPLSEYIDRLEYELKVIKEMGFNTYMLVVSDFTTRAKQNTIMVGPWRGSGAGSLLAYLTHITDVNPFAYDLLFERFLNPARISMPDFDIDFEDNLRNRVIEYVQKKYGYDHVSAIGTYMTLATKAAFKDAARAIGIPFDRANDISNMMDDVKSLGYIVQGDSSIGEELEGIYEQDQYVQQAIKLWAELEGNLRQLGVHACGIIIAPEPVTHYTATQIVDKSWEDTLVSQFDGPTLETIGLLKMDFLGLRNLSVIKNCIKIIRAKYAHLTDHTTTNLSAQRFVKDKALFEEFMQSMSFNPDMKDEYVFKQVFMKWDTTWIFQFEWDGMRRFLVELAPNRIDDLVAMNALYRPGPMEFIPSYIKRKHGQEPIDYMLPELRQKLMEVYHDEAIVEEEKKKLEEDLTPILGDTYGIAVYQEQLMFIVQAMAWFSLPEADLLRRWVGKKIKKIIDELKVEFMQRGQSFRGYKPETAKIIYEKMIEPAASYSFNKSHAVCYAHIAYQTWYLKAYYPLEFYASLLRSTEEDTDRLSVLIDEVHNHGIIIEPPHINKAYNHIAAWEDHIIMGFYACKWVGFDIGEQIETERKQGGEFTSLENFLERCQFLANKRTLESLVKAGAFDHRYDRNTLLLNLQVLLDWHKKIEQLDEGLFGGLAQSSTLEFQQTSTTSRMEKAQYDVEIFKNMISWHPFDGLYPYIKRYGFIDQVLNTQENTNFSCLGMVKKITRARKKWFFILIEDVTGSFEFFVKDKLNIKLYNIYHISGYKSRSRNIKTMIKIDIIDLIEKAKTSNKYDPQRTVTRVKSWRGGIISAPSISLESEETQAIIEEQDAKEIEQAPHQDDISTWATLDTSSSSTAPNTVTLELPDSLEDIKHIITSITSNPWEDHTIHINNNTYHISTQGMEAIKPFLP